MEPKKILAINGSPRGRKSNTDQILQPFLQGAMEAGAVCETVYAVDLDVKECIGCYNCWKKTPGVCVFKDDMVQLMEKIRQADILVWATPVYHFGMNVRLRRIVERTLPTCLPYMVKKGDRFSHPQRFDDGPSKNVLIANCGFPDRSNFDQLVGTFQKIAGGHGLAATILCGGGELFAIKELQGKFDWYIDAVMAAGREMVERGSLTEETEAVLERPLMPVDLFVNFANASWEVEGETPPSVEQALADQNGADVNVREFQPLAPPTSLGTARDLIAGMPMGFQPEVADGLSAILQFDVTGEEPGQYFLQINGGQCKAFEGKHPAPQLTIHTPSSVWLGIARGELDGTEAMLQGKYSAEGDMNLMIKFGRLFKSEAAPSTTQPKRPEVRAEKNPDNLEGIFKGMALRFNPKQAPDLAAVFQFKVTGGAQPSFYQLQIADGKCSFQEGAAPVPSVTVITPAKVWLAIARGELDGSTALMEGQYTYEGDLNLLMRMKSIFSEGGEAPMANQRQGIAPGPIKIPGMQWLTVAFLPWIYFWVFSGNHRLSSLLIPLIMGAAILLYRIKFIEPTPMDIGGPIFFGIAIIFYFLFPQALFKYGPVLGTLAQGFIWAVTLISDKPLTLSYAKYNYPAGFEENALFITINAKITAFWVAVYLIQALIAIAAPAGAAYRSLWMAGSYILLIPAFIFTARFPEWYISRRALKQG